MKKFIFVVLLGIVSSVTADERGIESYCAKKALYGAHLVNERVALTVENEVDIIWNEFKKANPQPPKFVVVDMERMVRDAFRTTLSPMQFFQSELSSCAESRF